MKKVGKLVRSQSGSLVYKAQGSALVYYAEGGDWTQVYFAWDQSGTDLDIMARWSDGGPTVGWDYNKGSGDFSYGDYGVQWSGAVLGSGTSEWVRIKRNKWSDSSGRFLINLNYYGEGNAASTCTVVASQIGGKTITKFDAPCGQDSRKAANASHPGVAIIFDKTGKLTSVDLI
jgi:hypothetical protein